jgi:hypothetical protein
MGRHHSWAHSLAKPLCIKDLVRISTPHQARAGARLQRVRPLFALGERGDDRGVGDGVAAQAHGVHRAEQLQRRLPLPACAPPPRSSATVVPCLSRPRLGRSRDRRPGHAGPATQATPVRRAGTRHDREGQRLRARRALRAGALQRRGGPTRPRLRAPLSHAEIAELVMAVSGAMPSSGSAWKTSRPLRKPPSLLSLLTILVKPARAAGALARRRSRVRSGLPGAPPGALAAACTSCSA